MIVRFLLLCLLAGCQAPASVKVTIIKKDRMQCSGVPIHNHWVLTAAHCMGPGPMWVNGLKVDLPIVPNPEWDMAMLHVPGLKGIKDVVWADHKPKVGDTSRLLGWGCPLGHYRQIESVGRVVSIDGRDLMYDVPMCIGDSGGPVYDQSNRLVGLIVRMIKSNHHAVVQYLAE